MTDRPASPPLTAFVSGVLMRSETQGQADLSRAEILQMSTGILFFALTASFGSSNYLLAAANSAAGFGLPKSLGDSHSNGGRHVR